MRLAVAAGFLLFTALCGCGDDDPAASDDPFCTEAEELAAQGLAAFEPGDTGVIPTNADMDTFLDRLAVLAPSSLDFAFEVVTEADLTDPETFTDARIRSAVSEISAYLHSHCDMPSQSSTQETVKVSACTELLPDGTILRDDMFDLYCIGTSGNAEIHRAEVRQCADGRSLYLSDLGWGYLGEPWRATDPPAAELAGCDQ